jgi:hypothetical protein
LSWQKIFNDFVLYPNRTREFTSIHSQSATAVKILVHDLLGRKLFDKEYENTGSLKKHSIATYASGYLFIDGY